VGTTIDLLASGGGTYVWSGVGIDASNQNLQNPSINNSTTNATYWVTVTDNGCSSTASTTVIVNPLPSTSISGNTQICQGANATLNAGNGFATYQWSSGATTQTVTTSVSGNYVVTVTNANGCSTTATTVVNENPLPLPNITGPSELCFGVNTTLTANAGYTNYSWSNGSSITNNQYHNRRNLYGNSNR
jgi:hypothetical protein